jgi:hypothetical protein
MPEYAQHHPPQIPLRERAPTLEQPRRRVLLARLVLRPGVAPVAARLRLRCGGERPGTRVGARVGALEAPVRRETREDEDRLDAQLLEGTEVGLDALGEREREPAGRGQQRLAGGRGVCELGEVVGGVDAEARVGEGG